MKKLICVLFSLIFCFSICFQGISVSADSLGLKHKKSGKCGDNVYWNYDEKTKTVILTGSGPMADYDYEGDEYGIYATSKYDSNLWSRDCEIAIISEGITSISDFSFTHCTKLKSISIPQTIEYIGEYAFSSCYLLDNVVLPEGLKTIKVAAFSNCISLNKITIPSTVKRVRGFFATQKLVEVCNLSSLGKELFPFALNYYTDKSTESKLTKIDNYVFLNMDNKSYLVDYKGNKSKLVLPESIRWKDTKINKYEIAPYAFYYQNSKINKPFEGVTIPSAVTKIGDSAFSWCLSLKEVNLSYGLKEIGKEAFLFNAFHSIKLPQSLVRIEEYAFEVCERLIRITIPKSVKFAHKNAFEQCYRLQEIRNLSKLPKSSFVKVPSYLTNEKQKSRVALINNCYFIILKEKVKCVGSTNPKGKVVLPKFVFHNNKIYNKYSIANYAFESYENITSIEIPNSVDVIGKEAFYDCYNLKMVTISERVEKVAKSAFFQCAKLKIVIIKGKNTVLNSQAFGYYYISGEALGKKKVKGLKIYCVKNSKALAYAKKNKISYRII